MPSPDPSAIPWRKSSYSNGDGGNCVEVADRHPGAVLVRDSKIRDSGAVLVVDPAAWADFVATV
ncbi:DUF397 domain-containing protein [Streptomyces sp. NBC_01498]|uniref:DUF397 domain-containing protein n=1 Tax=Streptomyces sp. NBC_01498 TaxID=2975870 RepID=UPI002E7B6826|nr:DUF397 domain-containing protein [Streptomyces sp. NBC_01498]WTL25770.1 DUF397 domain-containing protein [Streptomyces sp. NBC_01498]